MKKLYEWLTVWEKYTTTDKGRHNNPPQSSDGVNSGKRRRLKIPRGTQNNVYHQSSSASVVDISDVQVFDNSREI